MFILFDLGMDFFTAEGAESAEEESIEKLCTSYIILCTLIELVR